MGEPRPGPPGRARSGARRPGPRPAVPPSRTELAASAQAWLCSRSRPEPRVREPGDSDGHCGVTGRVRPGGFGSRPTRARLQKSMFTSHSKGKRKASADRVSEKISLSKNIRIDLPTLKNGEGPNAKEQKAVAAKRIQMFWRRICTNTLHTLVNRMIDRNITTSHVKSIRLQTKNADSQIVKEIIKMTGCVQF